MRCELNLFSLQISKVKTSLGYICVYERKVKNEDITRIFLSLNLDFLVDNCDIDRVEFFKAICKVNSVESMRRETSYIFVFKKVNEGLFADF